jgi:rhodanese-related sulfurtransferase
MERLPEAKDTQLVFYCGGPKCSASRKGAAKAAAAGYTKVADFSGGYPAWKARYGLDGSVDRAVPEGIEVLDWSGTESAMGAGGMLVDSRGPKSFATGHIAGAVNVPYKDEAAHSALPEDKATAVIFYCSGPVCSASTKGAEKALTMGYSNVKEYRGGYPDWASRQ